MSNKKGLKKKESYLTIKSIMTGIRVLAPAKINLHLEIGEKRSDGFHSIHSLFQAVSLYDLLSISSNFSRGSFSLAGMPDIPVEKNLIYRAAEVFREYTGIVSDIHIVCHKTIPEGGGLGGGSSDAASTLIGLNKLFRTELSEEVLQTLGEKLGSDVPFFFGSPTAFVSGRGEKVLPVATKWTLPLLIIETGLQENTAAAYEELDREMQKHPFSRDIISMYRLPPSQWLFRNDFYRILERKSPLYAEALSLLTLNGAVFSMVSGSGSSVFGIFDNDGTAERAAMKLKKRFKRVHKGKMLANPTQAVYNSENN